MSFDPHIKKDFRTTFCLLRTIMKNIILSQQEAEELSSSSHHMCSVRTRERGLAQQTSWQINSPWIQKAAWGGGGTEIQRTERDRRRTWETQWPWETLNWAAKLHVQLEYLSCMLWVYFEWIKRDWKANGLSLAVMRPRRRRQLPQLVI